MKLKNVITSGLAALALGLVSAHAQSIPAPGAANYGDGDLLLSFYGTSAANDTVFDIGTLAAYQAASVAGGTYTVAGFDTAGVADVLANTGNFGSSIYWNVASGNASTGELALTDGGSVIRNSSNYSGLAGELDTIGSEVGGNAGSGTSTNDAVLSDKPVYGQIGANASHSWTGGPAVTSDSVTTGTTKLYLYDLDKNDASSGNGIELGYFTLNTTTDSLTFTAIPEPSTYAAILGALTIGFVIARRRFGSSGLIAQV
jgi:hypothetical protein